jgi:hypothetical protein
VALLECASVAAGVRPERGKDVAVEQSAALFVGVRDFRNDRLTPVAFAVDDAVDLAYELAIDHDPILVPPNRVAVALSGGEPSKDSSRKRLKALIEAGATRWPADIATVRRLLEAQARRVGRNGLLLVSFATHGVQYDKAQHLLAADSFVDPPRDTLTDRDVADVLASYDVARSLVLIDACRERLIRDARAGRADPRSAFRGVMTGVDGQVLIAGAAMGGYAYDDEVRGNGVFTAAIIDGLRCGAAKDRHGFVTAETLYRYVSHQVLQWLRRNGHPDVKKATAWACEGEARKMPLSICVTRTASASLPRQR